MNTQITIQNSSRVWSTELERDPNLRSPHTRTQYAHAIKQFEMWRAGREISVALVEDYLATLQKQEKSQNTVKQALAAIRWLSRRAVKIAFDERPEAEAEQFERHIQRLLEIRIQRKAKPLPAGRNLELHEIRALLSACNDGTIAGKRDAAILSVTIATASRNEEIRKLILSDLRYTNHTADDGKQIPCIEIKIRHGKGDKPRVVEAFGEFMVCLNNWIEARGAWAGPLFPRLYRSNVVSKQALTYQGTCFILQTRFRQSGLAEHTTWHDFRRTAVGLLFDMGIDTATQMRITGHENVDTLRRYDRRPDNRRMDALLKMQQFIMD